MIFKASLQSSMWGHSAFILLTFCLSLSLSSPLHFNTHIFWLFSSSSSSSFWFSSFTFSFYLHPAPFWSPLLQSISTSSRFFTLSNFFYFSHFPYYTLTFLLSSFPLIPSSLLSSPLISSPSFLSSPLTSQFTLLWGVFTNVVLLKRQRKRWGVVHCVCWFLHVLVSERGRSRVEMLHH